MTQFTADNNMWKNLVAKDITNMPLANYTRLALLLKDVMGFMKNTTQDEEKYLILKELAKQNNLLDPKMAFYEMDQL